MERVLAIVGALAIAAGVFGALGFGLMVLFANAMSDAGDR